MFKKIVDFFKSEMQLNKAYYQGLEQSQPDMQLPGEDQVKLFLGQYRDTTKLIRTTLKPDVFFKRLNFLFDILLALQQYESVPGMFTEKNPSRMIKYYSKNIDCIVSSFTTRYIEHIRKETRLRKTALGKEKYYGDALNALISAFDCAHTFWSGNGGLPHYTGPLFSKENYKEVEQLWDEFCDNNFADINI